MTLIDSDSQGSNLLRLSYRRKTGSFLVVSATIFVLFVFGWLLTIRQYQSKAEIPIRFAQSDFDRPGFQSLLANAIRTKISQAAIAEMLATTREQVAIQSQLLNSGAEKLRRAMLVQTVFANQKDRVSVVLTLDGRGTRDERIFLQTFSTELASLLSQQSNSGTAANQFVVENVGLIRNRATIERLEQSVEKLDTQINEVCKTLEVNGMAGDRGPFRNASHSNRGRDERMMEVHQSMSSIDVGYLRTSLADLKAELAANPGATEKGDHIRSTPVGSPALKQLFVLLVLSLAAGLLVAVHYQPFADRGFTDLAAVSKMLKTPVVAALPITLRGRGESLDGRLDNRKLPWANRLTGFASILLLAALVFVAGFCCIDSEIRETFFQNPIDGLARVMWYFKGH